VVWLWLVLGGAAAAQLPDVECERAGATAERAAGLPSGLLLAIGEVESGRFDAITERRELWPWAVASAAGMGLTLGFRPKAEIQAETPSACGVGAALWCAASPALSRKGRGFRRQPTRGRFGRELGE